MSELIAEIFQTVMGSGRAFAKGCKQGAMAERIKLIVLALAVLLLPQVALGDALGDAVAAYERRDYTTALQGFKRFADQDTASGSCTARAEG